MGACDCYVTVTGRTAEARKKDFWTKVEMAKYDHGHGGYTGSAAEFYALRETSRVFDTHEQLQDWIGNVLNDKNVAYLVQVKTFKDTPTIQRWCKEASDLSLKGYQITDAKAKAANKKQLEKLYEKIRNARKRKAEVTKQTVWIACGWVSE